MGSPSASRVRASAATEESDDRSSSGSDTFAFGTSPRMAASAAFARDADASYGVHVNPTRTERFVLGAGDQVIVLAED